MAKTSPESKGPRGYENWRCMLEGIPARSGEEVQLYSDAHVTDEIADGCGPYQLLNTIGIIHQPACVPVLVLRTMYHYRPGDNQVPNLESTDTSTYHGGGIAEEISALVGLALGIRLRPGGTTRHIDIDPPRERPLAEDPALVPTLVLGQRRRPKLPNMQSTVTLDKEILAGYTNLCPKAVMALVRAARLYQHGLWLSESNPSDAWLMFVSAVEVAAVDWRSSEVDHDCELLLRKLKPDWVVRLEQPDDPTLVRDMANELASLIKATDRFLKFLLTHLPEAPQVRPTNHQVKWTKNQIRKGLTKIYEYRSHALHGGIPFPSPMCSPPTRLGDANGARTERPLGMASASQGGVWKAEDLPMCLHIFVYIVRGALLKWWEGMKNKPENG